MAVAWYRRKRVWAVAGLLSIGVIIEGALLFSGKRVFVQQTLVHPRQTYIVSGFGDVGKQDQASLVCHYFTGRHIATNVLWYSATNQLGVDECPFFTDPHNNAARSDGDSAADWVSGLGSLLAVIAALFGYFLVEKKHRKDDRDRLQGHIYQLGFKLSTLASEVRTTLRDLNPRELPLDKLIEEKHPLLICGTQGAAIGYDASMVRDLSDAEQNALMLIREEEFLMNFSECVARNESVRNAFVEYGRRREGIVSSLPTPDVFTGETGTFELTQAEYKDLLPKLLPATSLVRNARYLAKLNVDMVTRLCDEFMPMMKRHYPNMHVHKIELIELPPGSQQGL